MIGGFRGVVHEAGAAAIDAAREECRTEGFVVGDALEGADYVGSFEVLKTKPVRHFNCEDEEKSYL